MKDEEKIQIIKKKITTECFNNAVKNIKSDSYRNILENLWDIFENQLQNEKEESEKKIQLQKDYDNLCEMTSNYDNLISEDEFKNYEVYFDDSSRKQLDQLNEYLKVYTEAMDN
jgi:hypothetical protein